MHIMSDITTFERLLDLVRRVLDRCWRGVGLAAAYLLGVLVNAQSDPSLVKPIPLILRLYDVRPKPLNWVNWFATAIVILLPPIRFAVNRFARSRNYVVRLSQTYSSKIDSFLAPYQRGRIAWGPELILQSCPDIHKGWPLAEVEIKHDRSRFVLQPQFRTGYERYLAVNKAQGRFVDDRTLLMLTKNPDVFSDRPTLILHVQELLYSEFSFFKENVAVLADQRHQYIGEVLNGTIRFPNSLCLHMVVLTSDGYLLLTQRSTKVDMFKAMWSCSVEEQLNLVDLKGSEKDFAKNWCERLLFEELGVEPDGYDLQNSRVFAVFIESDVLNLNLAGITLLKHDRKTLDAIIDKHPRTDYEFQTWEFVAWNDLPKELMLPSRPYHPSSGLRMFLAGIHKFGAPAFGKRIQEIRT
jgi:isopentenyldiphosphate isomerase